MSSGGGGSKFDFLIGCLSIEKIKSLLGRTLRICSTSMYDMLASFEVPSSAYGADIMMARLPERDGKFGIDIMCQNKRPSTSKYGCWAKKTAAERQTSFNRAIELVIR